MSTDLVHMGQQPEGDDALINFDGFGGGALAAVSGNVTIENIELIQNTSRAEGGIPGQLRCKETGNHVAEVFSLPIYMQTKRVLFPAKGSGFGAEPLCRSNDGNVPAPGVPDKKSNDCHTCPLGPMRWKAYGAAKRRGASKVELQKLKPVCDEKLEYVYIDLLTMKVRRITVGGVSISQLKKSKDTITNDVSSAQTLAKIEAARAKAKGLEYTPPSIGMYSFTIHMKPRKIAGADGVFYVLDIKVGSTPFGSPEEKEAITDAYNDLAVKVMQQRQRTILNAARNGEMEELEAELVVPAAASNATMGEPVIGDY